MHFNDTKAEQDCGIKNLREIDLTLSEVIEFAKLNVGEQPSKISISFNYL